MPPSPSTAPSSAYCVRQFKLRCDSMQPSEWSQTYVLASSAASGLRLWQSGMLPPYSSNHLKYPAFSCPMYGTSVVIALTKPEGRSKKGSSLHTPMALC